MRKETFIKDANHTLNEARRMHKKALACWNCRLIGNNILDEFGCCKRCGTNITKYPTKNSHAYPRELLGSKAGDEALVVEVLGSREKFVIPEETDQNDW